jgi:hypothetical protein
MRSSAARTARSLRFRSGLWLAGSAYAYVVNSPSIRDSPAVVPSGAMRRTPM